MVLSVWRHIWQDAIDPDRIVAVPVAWRQMAVPAVPVQVFGEGLFQVTKSELHREIREAYMFSSPRHAFLFVLDAKPAAKRLQANESNAHICVRLV